MRQPLTDRQAELLHMLRAYIAKHGYAPTLRELCILLGTRSTNGMHEHLRHLEEKGYVTRSRTQARALKLVDEETMPPLPTEGAMLLVEWMAAIRRHRVEGLFEELAERTRVHLRGVS